MSRPRKRRNTSAQAEEPRGLTGGRSVADPLDVEYPTPITVADWYFDRLTGRTPPVAGENGLSARE